MNETAEPLRILAIDDSASARKVFQEVLLLLGVSSPNLRLAADGAEGLRCAAEWDPDVVFLDVELHPVLGMAAHPPSSPAPELNGVEVGRQLLGGPNRRPKVVVVTALDRDEPRVRALVREGASDVIMKPIRAQRVDEVLRKLGFVPPPTRPRG